jgi:hypothetical protein
VGESPTDPVKGVPIRDFVFCPLQRFNIFIFVVFKGGNVRIESRGTDYLHIGGISGLPQSRLYPAPFSQISRVPQ